MNVDTLALLFFGLAALVGSLYGGCRCAFLRGHGSGGRRPATTPGSL